MTSSRAQSARQWQRKEAAGSLALLLLLLLLLLLALKGGGQQPPGQWRWRAGKLGEAEEGSLLRAVQGQCPGQWAKVQ